MKLCACGCGQILIKEQNSFILGHNGKNPSKETREKIGRSHKGKKRSEQWKRNIGIGNTGKKRTIEQRKILSLALKGRISHMKGKKFSLECRDNLSKIHKEQWKDPNIRKQYVVSHIGKHQTDETKKKISLSTKGKSTEERYGKEKAEYLKNTASKRCCERILRGDFIFKVEDCKRGHFYSQKNSNNLYYRSSYELLAYQILEAMEKVVKYKVEPFYIEYEYNNLVHRYIPDILVWYSDGSRELIEIKARYKLTKDKKTIAKISGGKKYADLNNLKFSIWTEKELKNDKKV